MQNLRSYGGAPYRVAAIHGGPGALGSVAPVARVLAEHHRGVLEPLQTAMSIDGQVEELGTVLSEHADGPAALIGHSWGAWLAWIVTARHPDLVSKLILVSSGPFETLSRDMVVMSALTVSLFLIGYGFRGRQGRVNCLEGAALLLVYVGYTAWLISTVMAVKT